ncbi:MAG: hypothetical protein NVSMB32_12700 [Actinomycetota bacterium]
MTPTVDAQRVTASILAGVTPAVSFPLPAVMHPGAARLLEVRIAQPSQLIAELNRQLTPAGVTPVAGGDPMGATLTGDGFHIEATTPARQALAGADVAVWQWDVTPLHSGAASLTLCFSLEVATPGGRLTSPASCLAPRPVKVSSLPAVLAQGFVGRHLLSLLLALALVLLAGAVVVLRPVVRPGRRSAGGGP